MTIHDFLRALRRRKIRGRLDRDGDIFFTHASLDLCLRRSEDDPDFFSLEYGGTFREVEVGDEEFYAYLLLAAAVARGVKIGKVCVIVGDVRNEFPQPKALIRVEAAVYEQDSDWSDNALASCAYSYRKMLETAAAID